MWYHPCDTTLAGLRRRRYHPYDTTCLGKDFYKNPPSTRCNKACKNRRRTLFSSPVSFASIAFGYPNAFHLGRTQTPVVVLLGPRGRSAGIVFGKANVYSGSVRFGGDTLQVNFACKRRQNARYKKGSSGPTVKGGIWNEKRNRNGNGKAAGGDAYWRMRCERNHGN